MSDLLLTSIGRLNTMDPSVGTLENAEILVSDGIISWIGGAGQGESHCEGAVVEHLDCGGNAVLPALVDSHTHLLFGGDRASEFALRSSGVSYEEIAKQGGGIRSTVTATREASEEELLNSALPRLDSMLRRGVSCVEIKSGYGLDLATELKMLRVIEQLNARHPIEIVATFLGAHTVPPEFNGRTDDYVDHVMNDMLPAVAEQGVAEYCDVFCEEGAFTVAQTRRIFERAVDCGLRLKLHAEQLHHTGGTALAAEMGAVSVDHLEMCVESDVEALANSGQTTAVLLPGATLYLGLNDWAPARKLIDAGVKVALATDCNPGSCMCDDLPLMTTLACTRLGMSPQEALSAVTHGAACAVGRGHERGQIALGKVGDFLILDATHEEQLPYRFGRVPTFAMVVAGKIVSGPGR